MRFSSWVWMTNHIVHPRYPARLADKDTTFDPNKTYTKIHFIDGDDRDVSSELAKGGEKDAIEIDGVRYSISNHYNFRCQFNYTDGTSARVGIMGIRVGASKSGETGPQTGKLAFRLNDRELQKAFEGRDGPGGKTYPMDQVKDIEITKFVREENDRESRMLNHNIHLLTREQKVVEKKEEETPASQSKGKTSPETTESSNKTSSSSDSAKSQKFPRERTISSEEEGENRDGRDISTFPATRNSARFAANEEAPTDRKPVSEAVGASPSPVCFTKGTLISTEFGEIPVEDLNVGDLILTKDNGLQAIRWVGRRHLGQKELGLNPKFRPIRISANALGVDTPRSDLAVSPQHRILIQSAYAKMLTGSYEVLIPAKKLIGLPGVEVQENVAEVFYYHILLDRHEIVYGNGALAESFYLTEYSRMLLRKGDMEALPCDIDNSPFLMQPARPFVSKNSEVKRLISDIQSNQMDMAHIQQIIGKPCLQNNFSSSHIH